MDVLIHTLWSWPFWFGVWIGITVGMLAAWAMLTRREPEPEGPPTILILPPDEPMEQLDINAFVRRYS